MAEIKSILSRLEKIFSKVELDYVIVGGLAAIIKGKARTTTDVDLILADDSEKVKLFLEELKTHHFDVLEEQVQWAFDEGTNASIFDKLSVMRLDIKTARKKIDKEALLAANYEMYGEYRLKIASVEYILLGKVWFLGDISDINQLELLQYNDVLDFLNVFNNNQINCNLEWLKKEAEDMGLLGTLSRLLNLAATFRE